MFIDQNNQLYKGDMRVDDREATPEEMAAWEEARVPSHQDVMARVMLGMKARRLEIFQGLNTLQNDALTDGNQALALVIKQAKSSLTALNDIDLSGYQTAEAMEQAIQLAYWGIVSQAPQEVQDAFNALVPR